MESQAPFGQFFCYKRGRLIKRDGSDQAFNGFRALYSNRLHYTTSASQAELESYTAFPTVNLDAIAAGRVLEAFVAARDCHWAEFETHEFGTEQPILQGTLEDPNVVGVTFGDQ